MKKSSFQVEGVHIINMSDCCFFYSQIGPWLFFFSGIFIYLFIYFYNLNYIFVFPVVVIC